MDSTDSQTAPKRGKHRHILFCFLPQVPLLLFAVGAFYRGYWLLLPTVFLMLALPILDALTRWQDSDAFQKSDFTPLQISLLHWNTRLYAVGYIFAVLFLARSVPQFTNVEICLAVSCASLLGGIAFAASHELLHCKDWIDQLLQRMTTTLLFYPHYKLIHIQSHHAHAATDHDKNTAWLDEGIYAYILRTIPESMARCWQMEAGRVSPQKHSIASRILRNQMTWFAIVQALLLAGFYWFCGPKGILFYLAQIVGTHVVLESVNYIQHYGLLREKQDGQYEKTGPEHSWDTYHYFSSYATFRVGHHSFHHISVKPYYLLAAEPEAPKLPVGYFWAIPMVMVPPLWRRVINPKLDSSAGKGASQEPCVPVRA